MAIKRTSKSNRSGKEGVIYIRPAKLSTYRKRKYAQALRMLEKWMADESGEQERSWAVVKPLLIEQGIIQAEGRNGKSDHA